MKTIGQIFKSKREEKKLDLTQAERATKIRLKYLEALENGDYKKLPQSAFTRGFIKNYSEFLGLPVSEMLALYRREYDKREEKKLLPESVVKEDLVFITPKRLTIIFIILLFFGFFGYLFWEYQSLAGAPALMVISPSDNSIVSSRSIDVTGRTDPDALVKINDQTVGLQNGIFDQNLELTGGLNTITVTATSKRGKTATVVRHVQLNEINH